MKAIKLQYLGILLLTQLAGCLGNNGTTATSSNSARISYAGSSDPATLTQTNSAALLAGAYQGGQTGTAVGSTAGLTHQDLTPLRPRTLLLSQALDNAVQQAIQNGTPAPSNTAAITDVSNQVAGNCGGQMSYSGTVNDENREFYISLSFDNYCNDSTTINGSATASGQTDESEPDGDDDDSITNNAAFNQDMYNNKSLAPNPLSISFDALTISSAGSSFSANGYALITKVDEPDLDEDPDLDAGSEPINPNNTPDDDDSAATDEQADVGGSTTIKLNCLLRDDATKIVYKTENFDITLTNGADATTLICPKYVDASLSGRYYDPNYGYVDISTPTPLHICGTDYWPSSGVFHAAGNNDSASFTALSKTTYQLDIDGNGDGTPDITTTGLWSDL